jgi:hypothetical protein
MNPFYVSYRIYVEVFLLDEEDRTRGIIVDPRTGETKGRICHGDRVLKAASVEYLTSTQEWKLDNFFKGHAGEINKWMEDLSVLEKALLFCIAVHVNYEDCHLQYSNGNDIGTEELVKISGMGRRQVYETINSLIKKDIIYKGKNSKNRQYFVNPWLFCKGNRINKVLKTMFKNYRIRVLGGVQWKNLR